MTHNPLAGWTGAPLLLWEGAASMMAAHLSAVAGVREVRRQEGVLARLGQALKLSAADDPPPSPEASAPYFLENPARHDGGFFVANRAAYMTISGPLERTGGWWWDGYDTITERAESAFADDQIDGVFLSITSPGGHASGMLECAQTLRGLADQSGKPLHVHAPALIASAAYGLGVAADHMTIDADAICGSVGVVMLHADMSKMLDDWGITLTPIQHGEKKTDGNYWESLSDRARADLQAMIDDIGARFTGHVAARRGLDQQAVIDWQAGVLMGQRAVEAGMANDVSTERLAFEALVAGMGSTLTVQNNPAGAGATSTDGGRAPLTQTPKQQEDADMTLRTQMDAIMQGDGTAEDKNAAMQALLDANPEPTAEDETPDAADDEADAESDEPDAEASDDDADAEDDDVDAATAGAIIALPEAKGRADYAVELAQTPGMTVQASKSLLAKAPKGKRGTLATKMEGQDPDVRGGTADTSKPSSLVIAMQNQNKAMRPAKRA